jgi:hypothetical protein
MTAKRASRGNNNYSQLRRQVASQVWFRSLEALGAGLVKVSLAVYCA